GTNGKSTTSALLEHILRMAGRQVQLGANFGTPSLALKPMEEEGVYVLEMSSYQLDLTEKACFNASILLNITPDHIDRHGSMENYVAAKQRIFDRQAEGGLAAIGLDDGYCRDIYITLVRERHHVMLPFATTKTMHEGISVDENGILHDRYDQADPHQFDLHDAAGLKGRHNWQNIAASYGVCRHLGVAPQEIMDAVYAFPGLPHRLERVGEAQGVVFYNDSKATNAEATSKALEPFETIYWIIGGRAKEGGIDALEPYFPRIAHAFLMGEAEDAFAQTLEGKVPYTRCGTLEVATQKAAQQAFQDKQPEAVVLLSPACASFDQWRSFEERGDAFRRYVSAIAGRGAA
ncbi:MAG: UDP-N-acetylmuramoyl-L-alanine--D-glutamate ligase, partial [Rickettsiales bacterium]